MLKFKIGGKILKKKPKNTQNRPKNTQKKP